MQIHYRFALARKSCIVLSLVLGATTLRAESSLEKALKTFSASTVQGYVQPLQDLFAANMTSGWYRSANIPQTGFNISFNIIAMGAILSDDQKTYDAATPAGFNPATFRTATVFGKTGATVTDANNPSLTYRGSDGAVDVGLFPLATFQATIGSLYGTELIIRALPLPEISGAPKVSFWGIGGRHSISQYFGPEEPPVHVAFGVFYNKVSFGDLIDVTSFYVGPQVSKSFSVLELYGGFGYTSNTMNIRFTSTSSGNTPVDITLDGKDKVRGTVGAALNLGILHLHTDLNFGSVTAISASVGFGF